MNLTDFTHPAEGSARRPRLKLNSRFLDFAIITTLNLNFITQNPDVIVITLSEDKDKEHT